MPDIPRVAVEHEDCEVTAVEGRGPDVEGGELFVVRGRDHEFFEVGHAELGGAGNIVAGIVGDVGGVD